jgi:putative hydrolase of the HAD superfamily
MRQTRYRHIFIDLDKTLWDFESSARETFEEIFKNYDLNSKGIAGIESFLPVYTRYNEMLWRVYRQNKIPKELLNLRRFELTLNDFGINDPFLISHIADDYVRISPEKTNLFPGAQESLQYLSGRYDLHVITNGFEEVQQRKLDLSRLRKYFKSITTSEEAGVKKPELGIFRLALKKAGAQPGESIMIGDDLKIDLAGARTLGMDQVYFNPGKHLHSDTVTYEISSWQEVRVIL